MHATVELPLAADAEIEIAYRGGVEVLAPEEDLRVGDSPWSLRILDFRQEGGEYVLLVEGRSGRAYDVVMRTVTAPSGVQGGTVLPGDSGGYARLRVTIPAGAVEYGRMEVRFRSCTRPVSAGGSAGRRGGRAGPGPARSPGPPRRRR
ncbi:MAG: hypothetical protein FIB01_07695 [Gemmatimonadetes bacterium]|nr:hypothetical protein [Gemmatimonadota bacterium]